MIAFVTGATGFLGSHLARVLAEQGADLRLLVRASSNTKNIDDLKADRVIGDLRDPASLEKGIAGCDAIFHVAADYRLWVRDPDEMYRSNVEGTRAILSAARNNNVRRMVYTSSVATMGFTSNGQPADEDSPVCLEKMIGPYKRSKFMAEQVAIEAARAGLPQRRSGNAISNPRPRAASLSISLSESFPLMSIRD
jgi:dihydroflavonol-4-reductase